VWFRVFILQNYPGFLGGGAKDCEEGFEDSEGKGKTGLKMMK
jgi:hypothetical protein